ncbi:hypothetical protein [Dactylosporangium sp. NPDC000521]|uniref:hypothetical protein n=1 Tax=Dactylosporangium sp. NPDC000521 TaxID=3363975 RepID=UPI0036BB9790
MSPRILIAEDDPGRPDPGAGDCLVPDDAWRVGSAYYNAAGTAADFDPSSCRSADGAIETCLSRQQIATISTSCVPER